jgi:anthranilate/para-aminobenzoate synthase component II
MHRDRRFREIDSDHPESIGTSHGRQLLANFLPIAEATV